MKNKKNYILMFLAFILVSSSLIITISYLKNENSELNKFELGKINPTVIEKFDENNNIKSDVSIRNDGNVDSYIRVALVFSYIDKTGVTLIEQPLENIDYKISILLEDWILGSDGYYYYKYKVKPNEQTSILVEECTTLVQYESKKFNLNIVTSAIQADPVRAVEEAWGVTITNGIIGVK